MKHPNIVLYKESFLDANQNLNIVTTFCEGGDLYQRIFKTQKNYFPEKIIINSLVQLLLGLSYIHDKKIVHRDIKTKNIFIQNEHTLRIGDFGIAKICSTNNNSNYNINKMVGTPLYMAPECFKQNKKYSYKSDIWSLGCCIYEMCNLKHAFEGQFFPAVSVKISEGKRLPVNKIYSKELRNVIDYMLDLNMRNRPTIAFLLEKTFMRKYVGEYINDFVANFRKYEASEEQINILKEQAEKFKIFHVKLYYENNLNSNYNNNIEEDLSKDNNNNNNDIDSHKKRIKINNKYYHLIKEKNKNEKKESLKINNNNNLFETKKILERSPGNKSKKFQKNNFIIDKALLQKQQNTINYNNYNETIENNEFVFNNNSFNKKRKNKKVIKYNNNETNEPEKINNKNISDDNYEINKLNKNNIGYWQLIDQILFLENILEASQS